MPVTHRIKITAAQRGGYSTSGAIAITAANPMVESARTLLARGADPSDRLAGIFEANAISPVALSRLAAPYSPPRANHKRSDPSRNVD
jgi:hypothetical protein